MNTNKQELLGVLIEETVRNIPKDKKSILKKRSGKNPAFVKVEFIANLECLVNQKEEILELVRYAKEDSETFLKKYAQYHYSNRCKNDCNGVASVISYLLVVVVGLKTLKILVLECIKFLVFECDQVKS